MQRNKAWVPIGLPLVMVLVLCSGESLAQVYRCTNSLGAVSYQDSPCDTEQQRVMPKLQAPVSSGLRPAEKAWLKQLQRRPKPKPARSTSGSAAGDKKRQEKACWKKQKQLDAVRAKLRRGYKPAQGESLRRKRRTYEEYLFRYCD